MKTKNLLKITLGLSLMILLNANAFPGESPKDKYKKVQSYVNNQLNYPKGYNSQNINGIVLVEYEVNTKGKLVIKGINASNQIIKDYVKNQFDKIEIKDTSFAEDTSFICKYIFVDEDNLENIDKFKFDKNLQPDANYLAER